MNINITPETERIVREELRRGHFHSVDDLIVASVQAWRERNLPEEQGGARDVPPSGRTNKKEKAREFVEWAQNHPHTPPLSDEAISRASLNSDRW
jgi:Arc/MetJ-type ribon-helix-helix transcriptional regulator